MTIETVPVPKAQWGDLVLRMDIPPQRKAVAFALYSFANIDGTRVFPGQQKVADMAGLHETNARKHIRALVQVGMLTVVRRGGGRGGATNSYRLSRPADITTLPLWLDPDMNRVDTGAAGADEYRASAPGERANDTTEQDAPAPGEAAVESVDNSPAPPVDNPETPSADAPNSGPANDGIPSVSRRNTERFGEFHRALALPDQPKTTPLPTQPPAESPNATTSLALVPPLQDHNNEDAEPEPAADEYNTARAVLADLPRGVADRWRRAAEAELLAAGHHLDRRTVTILAADLATRPQNGAA